MEMRLHLLANIFLHLAFDDWMGKTHPEVPFERYADDVIAHCASEEQAQAVKPTITLTSTRVPVMHGSP